MEWLLQGVVHAAQHLDTGEAGQAEAGWDAVLVELLGEPVQRDTGHLLFRRIPSGVEPVGVEQLAVVAGTLARTHRGGAEPGINGVGWAPTI